MAAYDVTIEDISLNTLGYGIDMQDGRRRVPGRSHGGVSGALMHGVNPIMGAFQPSTIALGGWVSNTNAAGGRDVGVTAGAQYEANLAMIMGLFARPGMLKVEKTLLDGTVQRAYARLVGDLTFRESGGVEDPTAYFKAVLELPYALWTSTDTPSWETFTGEAGSPWRTITSVAGSTAPITDALLRVHANTQAITNPRLETDTGYLQYNGTLAVGQSWVVDCGTWVSKVGTGITSTASGTSNFKQLDYGGSGPRLFDIWNPYRWKLLGTGTLSGVQHFITSRKKYL